MGPYGVLANEYVRKLSAKQFEDAPRRDTRAPREQGATARPPQPRRRLRTAARAFRRFAEVLLR